MYQYNLNYNYNQMLKNFKYFSGNIFIKNCFVNLFKKKDF